MIQPNLPTELLDCVITGGVGVSSVTNNNQRLVGLSSATLEFYAFIWKFIIVGLRSNIIPKMNTFDLSLVS